MPPKQRSRCDDEGSPAFAREEPARRRQEQPVNRRYRRTAGLPTEYGEFVLEDDDFQLFEVVRAPAQGSELKNPPKHPVAEREQPEDSA
jgi:hypothetical protein